MAIADDLLDNMYSWIEKRESFAEQLYKLALELESRRQDCNWAECYGSATSLVGAAGVVAAGMASILTAGAATPLLVAAGIFTGVGVTVSVGTKITEHFLSSKTLKKAQKIIEESNKISEKVQKLFKDLKAEVSSSADPHEVDQCVMTEILRAMARQCLKEETKTGTCNVDQTFIYGYLTNMGLDQMLVIPQIVGLAGVLTVFTVELSGTGFKTLITNGGQQLMKEMSKIGLKATVKGGAMVVVGVVGLGIALSEAIDDWTDLIKNNHVTKASQSLREAADDILKVTQTLKKQLDEIKKMFKKMAKSQQKQQAAFPAGKTVSTTTKKRLTR